MPQPGACTNTRRNRIQLEAPILAARELFEQSHRLRAALGARRPLSRWDWTRTLLAIEIVFASDVVGSGVEWAVTTGLDDMRTPQILRDCS